MSLQLRCEQCGENVTVDTAFAGSVYRCPFCKAMISVPNDDGGADTDTSSHVAADRPDAPITQEEADSHASYAVPVEAVGTKHKAKKSANARRILAMLIIMVILVATVAVGVFMFVINAPDKDDDKPLDENNRNAKTVELDLTLKIPLTSPILYCIDAGSAVRMRGGYERAASIVCKSIKSLKPGVKFNVYIFREMAMEQLSEEFLAACDTSDASAKEFLDQYAAAGSTIGTLQESMIEIIKSRPGSIVLIVASEVNGDSIIPLAKRYGVPISTLNLHRWDDADENLKKIASETEGQFQAFRESD